VSSAGTQSSSLLVKRQSLSFRKQNKNQADDKGNKSIMRRRSFSIAGYFDNVMNQCFVSRARSENTGEVVQV
jgi:hypothetical protein